MKKPSELPQYTVIKSEKHGAWVRDGKDTWAQVHAGYYQESLNLDDVDALFVPYEVVAMGIPQHQVNDSGEVICRWCHDDIQFDPYIQLWHHDGYVINCIVNQEMHVAEPELIWDEG